MHESICYMVGLQTNDVIMVVFHIKRANPVAGEMVTRGVRV